MIFNLLVSLLVVAVAAAGMAACRWASRSRTRAARHGALGVMAGIALAAAPALAFSGYLAAMLLAGQPGEATRELGDGLSYQRLVRPGAKPRVTHVVAVDMRRGYQARPTAPEQVEGEWRHRAATVGDFLADGRGVVAINASFFAPHWGGHPLAYSPRAGESVLPLGVSIWEDARYGYPQPSFPLLIFEADGRVRVADEPTAATRYAVAGSCWLVRDGRQVLAPPHDYEPRTAIGVDRDGRKLWLVVVDGRQPRYSEGAKLAELALLMRELGAWSAINLDGGGSSTLAWNDAGEVRVLNRPIHTRVPARQRPVANAVVVRRIEPGTAAPPRE